MVVYCIMYTYEMCCMYLCSDFVFFSIIVKSLLFPTEIENINVEDWSRY